MKVKTIIKNIVKIVTKYDWKYIIGCVLIAGVITTYYQCSRHNAATVIEDKINQMDSVGSDSTVQMKVVKFAYNKHQFLEINRPSGNYIVHDPNCKCMSTKLNNITTVITNENKKVGNDIVATTRNAVNGNIGEINSTLKHIEDRMTKLEQKCQPKVITKTVKVTVYKQAKNNTKRK